MKGILLWTVAVGCVLACHSFAAVVPGDIDGDQAVDSQDVLKAAQFLAGNLPMEKRQGTDQYGLADVDRSGEVTATDLVQMQNYVVGNDVDLDYPLLFVEYVGSGETGTVGQPLAESVGVRLQIVATWEPLEGMTVQFAVTEGNGSVQPNTVDTNADGEALTQWVLGTVSSCLGKDNADRPVWECHDGLQVYLSGYDPVTLYAFATPDVPDHMTDSWTEPTICLIKTNLYYYFNIHLYDQYDNPVPYHPISFSTLTWPAGASNYSIIPYDPSNYETSRYGTSSPKITIGNRPGQYVFQALVQPVGGSPLTLTETADTSTGPAVVCFSSGNWQTGINGETLANPSRFGAMEYVWSDYYQDYRAGYYDDVWLDMTVVADPPSDPVFGTASPAGGFTDVPWSGIYIFQTTITLPEATKLPTTAHLYAATPDARFAAPFNQIAGGAYIVPDRHLKIFLDADDTWETDSRDDTPYYVPGSNLMDHPTAPGLSLAVPDTESQSIQTVRIIAAFYDRDEQLTSPPEGVTQVRVTLEETSAFRGIAMNYGSNTDYDFQFDGGTQEIEVSFGVGGVAMANLGVYDYGGRTRVRASVNTGAFDIGAYGEQTLNLPIDSDLNWLPDSNYSVWDVDENGDPIVTTIVSNSFLAEEDIDSFPVAVPGPDPGGGPVWGIYGDGLTNFEEYRGFISLNTHIRTDPETKDLFILKQNLSAPRLSNEDVAGFGVGFVEDSGLQAHELIFEFGNPKNEIDRFQKTVNLNYTNDAGPTIPGHLEQKALKVLFWIKEHDEDTVYGRTFFTNNIYQIPIYTDYSAIYVNKIYYMQYHCPNNPSDNIMQTNQAFRLKAYQYFMTHELGHGVHMCHATRIHEDCSDGAAIDPDPTSPPDFMHMFIMQSDLFTAANDRSLNPTMQCPMHFHDNSKIQTRLRE